MKKTGILVILIISIALQLNAQNIKGNFPFNAHQEIVLEGFKNYTTTELAKTQADSLGNFSINYPKNYTGMALLKSQDKNSLVLLLNQENIVLEGTHLSETDSLQQNATANKQFFDYAMAQSYRKSANKAWKHLDNLYQNKTYFPKQCKIKKAIKKEQQRIAKEDATFVNSLDKESYLYWFIPYRTFIQEMQTIIRTETERIPIEIERFRTTNFNHPNFKTSGILKEYIGKHYFMLENSSGSIEEKQVKMNKSSLHVITSLQSNKPLLNTVAENLFDLLEDRSQYIAAAYLANELLNTHEALLGKVLKNKSEKYRNLKEGNTAPNIQLTDTKKLSDYKQPVLLVFGTSDCSHCKEGAIELLKHYDTWKSEKNTEVVYISLDTDKEIFEKAYQHAPWQTYCDFKGWDSKIAKDYHIWGTPSYFLLDKDLKILDHINSVAHANAWIMNRLK